MSTKKKSNPVSNSLLLAALGPIYNGGELDEATVVVDRNTGKQIVARTVDNKPVDKTEQRKKQIIDNMHKGMTTSAEVIFEGLSYLPVDPIGPIATNIAREIKALPILGRNLYDDYKYIRAIKKIHPQEVKKLRDAHFTRFSKTVLVDKSGNPIAQYHTVADNFDPTFTEFNPTIEGTHSAIYTTSSREMSASYAKRPNRLSKEELKDLLNVELERTKADYENFMGKPMSKEGEKAFLDNYIKVLEASNIDRTKQLYVRSINPKVINGKGAYWNQIQIKPKAELDKEKWSIIDAFSRAAERDYGITRQDLYDIAVNNNMPKLNSYVKQLKLQSLEKSNEFGSFYDNIRRLISNVGNNSTRDIENLYRSSNHDAIIFNDIVDYGGFASFSSLWNSNPAQVVASYNPRNLKLANPIVRDYRGKLIRLSQRDNFLNPDIRYSLGGKL